MSTRVLTGLLLAALAGCTPSEKVSVPEPDTPEAVAARREQWKKARAASGEEQAPAAPAKAEKPTGPQP